MIRSTASGWRFSIADHIAVRIVHEHHRVRRQPGSLQRALDHRSQNAVGRERFFAAAQHHRIARFDQQRGRVDRDVGPRLVDDRDHADRHADLRNLEARWGAASARSLRRPDREAAATSSTPCAIASIRSSVSVSRSSIAPLMPAARARSRSARLAARISARRLAQSIAPARASARFLPSVGQSASGRAAARVLFRAARISVSSVIFQAGSSRQAKSSSSTKLSRCTISSATLYPSTLGIS